jgi:hypothetical protein
VNVVFTDVDAIASLLLQVPAGLSPGRGFGVVYKKKASEVAGAGRAREVLSDSAEQFCLRGASSRAFQLLKIGKLPVIVKCGLLEYERNTLINADGKGDLHSNACPEWKPAAIFVPCTLGLSHYPSRGVELPL